MRQEKKRLAEAQKKPASDTVEESEYNNETEDPVEDHKDTSSFEKIDSKLKSKNRKSVDCDDAGELDESKIEADGIEEKIQDEHKTRGMYLTIYV